MDGLEGDMIDNRKREHFPLLIFASLFGLALAAYLIKFTAALGGGTLLGAVCLVALLQCITGRPYGTGRNG